MALATLARRAGILSLCLLLLSSLGASGTLAAAAPPAASVHASNAIVIGTGSCVGSNACYNAVGPIGDNSCNGVGACANTTGSIGDNSCLGLLQCQLAGTVGDNSCASGFETCIAATSVGDNSCDGSYDGCWASTVGSNSCHGTSNFYVCYTATVGNYSCNTAVENACAYKTVGDCAYNDVTPSECAFKPDARIMRSSGILRGNDIYNTDGTDQSVTTAAAGDTYRRFYISIQNDSLVSDSFTVDADGPATAGFGLRFFKGNSTNDITAAVEGGTFTTPVLTPGQKYQIRVRVYIGPGAKTDATLTRLVTATSVGDTTKTDAVGFSVRKR